MLFAAGLLPPYLRQSGLALDHPEQMLDLRAHAGLAVFLLLEPLLRLTFRQLGQVDRPACDVPLQAVSSNATLRAR